MTYYMYVLEPVMIDLSMYMYMKFARACVWCDGEQQNELKLHKGLSKYYYDHLQ